MDAAVVLQARWQSETPDQKKKNQPLGVSISSTSAVKSHDCTVYIKLPSYTHVDHFISFPYFCQCDQYLAMNFMVVKTITNQVHLET